LAEFRRYTRFDLSLSRRPIQSPARRSDLNKYGLISNCRRAKGVRGSNTDLLICAVAVRNNFSIYTTDKDFELYSNRISIVLHQKAKESLLF
jgi:predicted nucleic acid-binding protein